MNEAMRYLRYSCYFEIHGEESDIHSVIKEATCIEEEKGKNTPQPNPIIVALPCIKFTGREKQIIIKHGFLTYPEFLDNHYIRDLRARPRWLIKHIERFQVQFAIAPDYQYQTAIALLNKYNKVNWIFPLHRKDEVKYAMFFDWIGFPHRPQFRDYSLKWFLKTFRDKKKWYLGFWMESKPEILLIFDGFDTTPPETYSGKYGKIWLTWNKAVKPTKPMHWLEIFEINVRNFKKAIIKLLSHQITLSSILLGG